MSSSSTVTDGSSSTASLSGFLLGTTLYWIYFNRYEAHLYGWRYLNVFAAASLTLAISLTKIYGFSNGYALAIVASAAASFLVGLFSSCLYYRMCLSPLRKFPGPSLASVSSLWWPTQLSMKGSYKWLEHQHKKHGKFVRVGANDLSITDPDIMELAFGVKSRVGKGPWYDGDAPLCSMHTTRDKGLHDRRRRVWAPAFSEKALREYETEVQRLIAKLVQKIGEHKGSAANVTKWFALFSFEAMGQLAFGKDYEMLDSGEKRHELDMLDEGMALMALRLPPWFTRILIGIPGATAGYNKFIKFCAQELTWRVQKDKKSNQESDIMGWLLKAYRDVPHPEKDPMLQADARLIIVAGSDTTSATLTFMFYHLAQHPEIVRQLRDELDPIVAQAKPVVQDKDLRSAPILNGCINEALRLHPAVPSGLERLTPPEGLQVGDVHIPGNTNFFVPLYVLGRDPEIYEDPLRFLPERWSSQESKVKHKDAFAPFSMGPFGCIGKNLALMELRLLTTQLVTKFDLRFAEHEDGSRILTETRDHFTVGAGDLDICFTSRAL